MKSRSLSLCFSSIRTLFMCHFEHAASENDHVKKGVDGSPADDDNVEITDVKRWATTKIERERDARVMVLFVCTPFDLFWLVENPFSTRGNEYSIYCFSVYILLSALIHIDYWDIHSHSFFLSLCLSLLLIPLVQVSFSFSFFRCLSFAREERERTREEA